MTHLKPRERALLWLAYAQGSSHKEIAESLGLRTASVKLLLFRARRRLAAPADRQPRRRTRKERTVKLQCPFEQELLDAVTARRWPDRADESLRSHVAGCALCADVAEIAAAFFEDRDCARAEAVVPAASAVWWRAQIRAREEAARLAVRPLLIVQVIATICAAFGAIALAPAASHRHPCERSPPWAAPNGSRCPATSASPGCSARPPTRRCH